MQEQNDLTPTEQELESALSAMSPSAARIDPIAAALDAGRRSGRQSVRLWQSATAFMLLIGAGSWLMPANRNAAVHPHDMIETTIALSSEPSPAEPLPAQSIQALQRTVREKGWDGMPSDNLPAVRIIRAGDFLN